ncbi:PAS domain S-box protein [Kamptonema formosum]|uniref:PAS domain S-box protein n=1 Tax=Kamptonema formosum TaxID=331992 RepID=UPI000344B8F7|nr:PAS domain S-box protein [Oscillatoria sp. PCC 10802]
MSRPRTQHQKRKILLLLDDKEIQCQLANWLSDRYGVLLAEEVASGWLAGGAESPQKLKNLGALPALPPSFHLCIADSAALSRHGPKIAALKAASEPVFLPVLLVAERPWASIGASVLGGVADDAIAAPIVSVSVSGASALAGRDSVLPAELELRVENLLRCGRLSEELKKLSAAMPALDFRWLVENVRDYAIFMLDTAGNVVTWNAGAQRIMGYRSEEIVGQHFSCFYPREDIECGKPEKELQLAISAGQCEDGGVRVRPDGSKFWANMTITALRDERGQLAGYSAIVCDLTERRHKNAVASRFAMEKELCRANRSLRAICDCSQALVRATEESELLSDICRIIVETGGYRLAWVGFPEMDGSCRPHAQYGESPSYLESLGAEIRLSSQECVSNGLSCHPAYSAIRTGSPCIVQNILSAPAGSPWRAAAQARGCASAIALPLMESGLDGVPEQNTQANPVCFGVLTICASEPDAFDATEVQLLKELASDLAYGIMALRRRHQLRAKEAALLESQQRYRQLVELSPEAIVVASAGKIDLINTAGVKLLGAAGVGELIGQPVMDFVHPAFQEIFQERIRKVTEEKQAVPFIEETLLRTDGTQVSVESAVTPVGDANSPAVLVVSRDLTERKQMEEALRASEELHRLALSNISETILITDSAGKFTYISPNVYLIFEHSVEEVQALGNIYELLGERIYDKIQLERAGEIQNIEREIAGKTGKRRTLLVSVKRVAIKGGTVLYTCRDISDRKQTEEALQRSEELLRKVLETLPVGVWVTDERGRILLENPAGRQIWGGDGLGWLSFPGALREGEHSDWCCWQNLKFSDTGLSVTAGEWALTRALAKGETSLNQVIDIESASSDRKTILNSAVPLRNLSQEISGAIVVNQDVTELKRAQEALRESNRRIVNILESITDAFFALDRQWRLTYINRQAEQIMQKKREELLGKNVWEVFPETAGSVFFGQFTRSVETGQAVSFEEFYPPLNIWFEVHAYPGADGLAVYFHNVTERVEAARVAARAQEALQESAHQLQAVFEAAMDAMVIADDSGEYIAANPAAGELFGLPPKELAGRHLVEFATAPLSQLQQQWRRFRELGRATGEFGLRRADGSARLVEYSAVANFLPGRHLSVLRDVSHRVRTEEELRQYREQLEDLVEARTEELTLANEQLQREIGERKRVEAALRESQEPLRTLIDAMPDIVCFKDESGRWLMANQAMLGVFQLEGLDYRGLKDSQIAEFNSFYGDALLTCERTDEAAWSKGTLSRVEQVIPQPDGTAKIYDLIEVPLFHPSGGRKGLVVLGRDITERKQAEEQLSRLASIVESSDDAIVGKTLDGVIVSWNAGAEKIYGYAASEAIGRYSSVLAPPDHEDEMPQILERIQQGGRLEHYETLRLRKDGQIINVALTISPIFDATGSVTGVSTIARDITDRKRIEAALERLRHQNELILNSAGEGICGLDARGRITFVNPAASRMLGYEIKELLGEPFPPEGGRCESGAVSERLNKDSHASAKVSPSSGETQLSPSQHSPIYASLQDGSAHHVTDELFWGKNGSFPVEYVSTPILERGKIVGAVVTFKDITERLAVERMKDEFISVVSHELRTPLTSMRGALGLLAAGLLTDQPEKAKRMLDIALSNTERLVRLINDILDLERIQSGKIVMEKQLCDAGDLMKQAVEEMQAMALKEGVTLSVQPILGHPQGVLLEADRDRIVQVLTNLLSNAIKFSPARTRVSVTGSVREQPQEGVGGGAQPRGATPTRGHPPQAAGERVASVRPAGTGATPAAGGDGAQAREPAPAELLIAVADQGRGIPAEKLDTIFERFQQVDSSDSRAFGGTGLGLAICRTIVQQHGGRIWAESTLGHGSTFCFTLPLRLDTV